MNTNLFFQHFTNSGITDTLLAQIEISPWELFPGLMILLFVGVGFYHLWTQSRKKRVYKQKQRGQRTKLALPLVINTPVTQEFSVNTFDISLTGAFLAYEDLKHSMTFTSLIGKRSGIKVGDLVDIKVYTGRFSQFNCQAKVVRYNFSDELPPPKGIGIEFVNLNKRKKKLLESLIHSEQAPPQTA